MDFRKKFLQTVALRAVTGLIAFGGFCALIAPYTSKPFTAVDVVTVMLIGMLYPVGFGRPKLRTNQFILVGVLALTASHSIGFPIVLWVIVPMGVSALSCGFLLPYPEKNPGGHDGKHADVHALSSQKDQGRGPGDP